MTRRLWIRCCFIALALTAAACSSDGFDAGLEGEPVDAPETAEPTTPVDPTPTPVADVERVQILSGTVTDLGDRRDLTFTVDDFGDIVTALVPDVEGLVADEAAVIVVDAGFAPYLVETFPPTGDDDRVVDMWPPPGTDFVLGVNVFLQLDGPLDAVPVEVGDELAGTVNGQQFLAFDPFENWLVRVWLDDPIAVEVPGDTLTIGREVEIAVAADDIICVSGALAPEPTAFTPGAEVSFTLAEDPADTIRFRAPERLSASAVSVDCG